jgi:hypothetical protein
MVNEGFISSGLLSSIDYDRSIINMAILQPKVDKSEGDLMPK